MNSKYQRLHPGDILLMLITLFFCWHFSRQTFEHFSFQPTWYSYAIFFTCLFIGSLITIRHWKELFRAFTLSLLTSVTACTLYGYNLQTAQSSFLLKYILSSQSLIGWMVVFFIIAMFHYWISIFTKRGLPLATARLMTWLAIGSGFSGLLIRWYESYLMGVDIGHVPLSNLYEVLAVFMIITGVIHMWYERKFKSGNIGAFVLPIIVVTGLFMVWYAMKKSAYLIQPLLPALQSYWMKIHVPANFIGYGCFAIAAMISLAWLLGDYSPKLAKLFNQEELEKLMYQLITTGFIFFTIATILGALWANDAWGSYWQWDPKETWALIVWLNYAAWLHLRLIKTISTKILAWWALIGLFITLFAFLGVNIFLSGLHSYGQL